MKVNSELLYESINDGSIKAGTKFKVYKDDNYVTKIFWDGENFNWESGTFASGMLFDPLVDFEIVEEEKEIEKIDNEHDFYCYTRYDSFKNDIDKVLYLINGINATNDRITDTNLKLNELIDEVKKLKGE